MKEEEKGKRREKEKGGQLEVARRVSLKLAEMGRSILRPYKGKSPELFEFFGEDGELQLGLGERLYDGGFRVFGGGVAGSSHLADEEVLRAFEHFLFSEGERLAAAEGNETLEDDGDFEERSGAHALGVLLEAVLPVVVRVEFAGFEEAKDFGGFRGTNDGTKANGHGVGLRDHDAQTAGNNANHEVTFGSAVQDSVADLFNNAHTVIRVNDLVADLVVHSFGCPPERCRKMVQECAGRVKIYAVESEG
jgi:hypothetical protein